MPLPINPNEASQIDDIRKEERSAFDAAVTDLIQWLTTDAMDLPLHRVTTAMTERLSALAMLALAFWSALRLEEDVPACRVNGGASYTFQGWRREPVRTRFGRFFIWEPVYLLHQGKGPRWLKPHARRIGLAAGRMSLGVHLMVTELAARMPFAAVREVAATVGVWTPGPRAMLGIIDQLGPQALDTVLNPTSPAEEDEGTHVIIEQDDGGISHVRPDELEKRRRPNRRRTRARGPQTRLNRRRRRRGHRMERRRRRTGDKSKNCRMATVYVVYTLKVHEDGTVEGPLNRQVFGGTRNKMKLRKTVLRAAQARGWGVKPSIYLADGATCHWVA